MLNLRKLLRSWLGVDKLDFRVGGLTERVKMMNEGLPTKPNEVLTQSLLEERFNEANTGEETPSVIIVKGYDRH